MNDADEKRNLARFAAIALIFLVSASEVPAAVPGKPSGASAPVNVIFDTDMCIDPDDAMALAIVHALQDRHEANLLAVTVNLDEKWCAPYVDALNTFYGRPDIPIGTVRNGLSLKAAAEKIRNGLGLPPEKEAQGQDTFAQLILKRTNPDGSPAYPRRLTDGSQAPDATMLLRKTLAAQPDGSVVMIQVGNSSTFAALLNSHGDAISNLSGSDLVEKKVRLLSLMGGTFQAVKAPNMHSLRNGAGINFFEDVPSAQLIFDGWPTPIVVSGSEVGSMIEFPGESTERDFSYVSNHPIAESYRYVCAMWRAAVSTMRCPHDHHTMDPTAALYALRPDRNYFSLSKPGRIVVLPNGNVRFDENQRGKHHYLTIDEEQKARAQEAMIMLASQPPMSLSH